MRSASALLILAVLAFVPFFGYPEWRGTEARRVQIAAEMVESGDYIVPRLWGEETYAKPPFYYWVLAGSFQVFGVSPFSARLPSVLAFWLLAVVAFHFLRRWHGVSAARLGAGGVLIAPVIMHDVPFAEIDPMFAVLTVLSMLCLSDGVFDRNRRRLVLAGVLGGLAVMTKGPPYLMFCLGPLVLWWNHNRWRGIIWYLPQVVALYVVYKLVLDSVGPADDVSRVAVQETVGRLRFWEWQSLKGIPAHVVGSVFVIGLPFSLFAVSWFRTVRTSAGAAVARQNFLLYGALGAAVILVFSRDRSTRYMLPAVPMIVLGLAPMAARILHDERPPPDWIRRLLAVVGIVAGFCVIAIVWVRHPYPGWTFLALIALSCVALVIHSRGQLVRFAVGLPLVIAWTAFADRVEYAQTARDFVPGRASVLARELAERGIDEIETDGHVGTAILLHTRSELESRTGRRLRILGDYEQRRERKGRWVVTVDRGLGPPRGPPGYRDVLRVQLNRKKSLSLREKL
jgi:4-amino-4-deoxy-L-arabinose transferase-like glycosyltransferase